MLRAVILVLALAAMSAAKALGPLPAQEAAAATVPAAPALPPVPGSTKLRPLYVTPLCSPSCGNSEDKRSFIDKIWTDPIAAFTAVLAASTILLWWVTRSMAVTSKRALLDLERPIVYGGVSKPGLKVDGARLDRQQLELSIYNHGRTLARLRRIDWGVHIAPKGTIADPIDPAKVGGRELPAGTVCVSGDPYGESENLFAKLSMEDSAAVARGEQSVWVVGFVRYDDVFGRHHISGFTQVFDPIGERFVRRGGERHNYERRERTKDIPSPWSTG